MKFQTKAPYAVSHWLGGVSCDMCSKEIDSKNGFYNCKECEYDLCLDCSGHNKSIES
jgi:hypothetical protein